MIHDRDTIGQVTSGAWFPLKIIQAKEFSYHQTREPSFFFKVLRDLRVPPCQTPGGLPSAVYWGVASVWPFYLAGLIDGVLQRWRSVWKVLLSSQRVAGALIECPTDSWSPPWLMVVVYNIQAAGSRKSPGGSELPFMDDGGQCSHRKLQSSTIVFCPFPEVCALWQFLWFNLCSAREVGCLPNMMHLSSILSFVEKAVNTMVYVINVFPQFI